MTTSARVVLALLAGAALLVAQGTAAAQDLAPPPADGAQTSQTLPATPPATPGRSAVVPEAPAGDLAAPPPSYGNAAPVGIPAYAPTLDVYGGQLHLPAETAMRMRALDRDLGMIGARGASNIIDGAISLVSAAALIGFGVALNLIGSGSDALSTYLYVSGGAILARALVELLVEPNPSGTTQAYLRMPMGSPAEVDARLAYGEHALESMAQRYQIARILQGSLSIASAAGLCLAYFLPNGFMETNYVMWMVLISAGLTTATGFITLLTRTDAERRWEAYKDLRDHLAQPGVELGVGPLPGGAAVTASGRF